jgi:hypothetical protein
MNTLASAWPFMLPAEYVQEMRLMFSLT